MRLLVLFLPVVLLAGGRYGPGIQADALANTTVGPYGNEVSIRFRAEPGGRLESIRPFLIWSFKKAGYHGGTGGILRVEVRPDDGTPAHAPGPTVLAAHADRVYLVPASNQFYPLLTFDRTPALRGGELYHLVFINTHPERELNYLSVNALFTREARDPVQPGTPDLDWALLLRNDRRKAWTQRRTPGTREGFTPILEVRYAGGGSQGIGYLEAWMAAGRPIGGRARVGEVFTPRAPLRIKAVAARIRRLGGRGPLRVRLEVEGRTLAQAPFPGCDMAPSASCSLGGCEWVKAPLVPPAVLPAGRPCRLVLEAEDPDRFEAFPLRKGLDKGFGAAVIFPDGHAELNTGSGWTGWEQWGKGDRKDSDLQFYFDLE